MNQELLDSIEQSVSLALSEDVGSGDITARLIDEKAIASARVITRENAVLCGTAWVDAVFRQVDPTVKVTWHYEDGQQVLENSVLFSLEGPARSILTGERCALNFLQTLSATATKSAAYAKMVAHTDVKLLDTRKTIPGLRLAQKYAVKCGGCFNHRIGLYDAFLIKENHIMACGSIAKSISEARAIAPTMPVEVEVESIGELKEALKAGSDIVMLDNFSILSLTQAVELNRGQAKLEASGGITLDTLTPIAETGVDFISIGTLTKDCKSIDLSMRITI